MYGEEAIDVRCMLLGSGGENWRLVKDGGNKQRGGFWLKPLVVLLRKVQKNRFSHKIPGKNTHTFIYLFIYFFLLSYLGR